MYPESYTTIRTIYATVLLNDEHVSMNGESWFSCLGLKCNFKVYFVRTHQTTPLAFSTQISIRPMMHYFRFGNSLIVRLLLVVVGVDLGTLVVAPSVILFA